MSEHYPYPTAEHYREPTNPLEVIDEELRLYPDGENMRSGIVAIGRIYQHSDMLYGLKKFAYLAKLSHAVSGSSDTTPGIDTDFYAGAIMGIHVMLRPAPRDLRQSLLQWDFLMQYSPWGADPDPDNSGLRQGIRDLAEYMEGGWLDDLAAQPTEHQERLLQLTARVYEDIANPSSRENAFGAGYLQTVNMIYHSLDEGRPHAWSGL